MYFLNLLNENTIFYLIKTKQSCYYLMFLMKVFIFVSILAYTSGFKCQRPKIFSLAMARPTREIVHQYVVYRNEDLRPLPTIIGPLYHVITTTKGPLHDVITTT
jgi:hypothetical protein